MAPNNAPNQFDLQGTGISIGYSTSSIAGRPQLTLKKGRQTHSFSGDEINTLDTRIGTLLTVTIAQVPDKETTTFSLLLPAINLATPSSKQAFSTIGITTVHKTSITGSVKGPRQTYKTVALRGSAQQVAFLTTKAAGS
jgi:hypothetical protein